MPDPVLVLQLGGTPLPEAFDMPDSVSVHHVSDTEVWVPGEEEAGGYDVCLLMRTPMEEEFSSLSDLLAPYTVFYTDAVDDTIPGVHFFLKSRAAERIATEELAAFLETLPWKYWRGQYGEKIYGRDFTLHPFLKAKVQYTGNTALVVEGNFGEELLPCFSVRTTLPVEAFRALELWPEYHVTEGSVDIRMRVRLIREGTRSLLEDTIDAEETDLSKPLIVRAKRRSYMTVTVFVKGEGTIHFGAIHVRHSRLGAGCLLPGGVRHTDRLRQEFYTYFHPMDCMPPLNVYFSGYRTAESFEGYYMMRSFGAPFLLIGDPRIEGGAYYTGSAEYEQKICDVIRETLEKLSFDETQLIISGLSMGSYGACYYAPLLRPYAVIAGKPLINGGQIALNAKSHRPDDFGTALDVLQHAVGSCDEEGAARFDCRMWDRMRSGEIKNSSYAFAYMRQDDYDRNAYDDLVAFMEERGVRIYGKGIEGRHNDNSPAVSGWFVAQFRRLMREDFLREIAI